MASWSSMKTRITASVRTTNRMNALLSESMVVKRKALLKAAPPGDGDGAEGPDGEPAKPRNELQFFRTNFSMELAYKTIEAAIEERLTWDRFSRSYDSWRSLQLAENLAADIRDRVKKLNYRRHRIVCILSVIEKQNQGVSARMRHLLDARLDNFAKYVYERPSYTILVTLFLVHKD